MPETQDRQPVGIDSAALLRWLTALHLNPSGELRFDRIGHGQSNLTYRVQDQAGQAWIVRRPPPGDLLASAHDVVREARIMSALADTDVPTPKILGVTQDSEISLAPLVVMEFVDGLVADTMTIVESLDRQRRRSIAESLARTLGKVHAVNLTQARLDNLASHKPYAARQLKRWTQHWQSTQTRPIPALDDLSTRLAGAMPRQHKICLVHGDYHLRNVILSPTDGHVTGLLDWELSTLGDPLADVGSMLAYWPQPGEETVGDFAPSTLPGFPDRAEMAKLYFEETGRNPETLEFWHVLGLWKLAIIAEGVIQRAEAVPTNATAPGTPTREQVDSIVAHARDVAAAAGF